MADKIPLEIIVADDEPTIRLTVSETLREEGHAVTEAKDGAMALELIRQRPFDLLVTDVRMPRITGMEVFRKTREESPSTDVILMTAFGAVEDAVEALKLGASDYLVKPFDPSELAVRIERIGARRRLQHQLASARAELVGAARGEIIGRSRSMVRLLDMVDTIAQSDAPVLITGETGTGKELVARRIHALSERRDKPFVAVNCAAFPETLLEAELFGHEAGAFTGAVKRREGRFSMADGGTLMLDEVGEIPPTAQAKLLRVLQEGIVEPLGTDEPKKLDVRVLSATHRDLEALVSVGTFREDLYYRLNGIDLNIPPLRERDGDLPLLVEFYLERFAGGRTPPELSPEVWGALASHPFYGNVRELEHVVQRAVVLSRGQTITLEHLPANFGGAKEGDDEENGELRPLSQAIKEFERAYIERALRAVEGKKSRAADLLGISRKNLWEKCRALGIV
ncbi:MAG: sigma-54 dependent transcriptional regulator [Deltaproteobacteria bacterium]|jgi:DNA-binding NtrC family response regulator